MCSSHPSLSLIGRMSQKPIMVTATDSLEVREILGKGRGVFAKRRFEAGELIERAPIIPLSQVEEPRDPQLVLYHYIFSWGPEGKQSALALGYGSLYNHSYTPNALYIVHELEKCIDFIAYQAIEISQEITINYNKDPSCQDPLWFTIK